MPKSSNGGEQGHNFWDLALNGLDDTTTPAIVSFGQLGKDANGVWHYTLAGTDGATIVESPDAGLMRVSALGVTLSLSGVTFQLSGDASGNRVSAVQVDAGNLMVSAKSNDAGLMRVSALGVSVTTTPLSADSSKISAVQGDAGILRTSAVQGDAGLLHVSAIGVTTRDGTIVDGTTQTISATLTPVSAKPGSTIAGLVVNANSYDASQFLVSSRSPDAGLFRVSSVGGAGSYVSSTDYNGDAGLFRTSALLFDAEYSAGPNVIVSANTVVPTSAMKGILASVVSPAASAMRVSAFSNDAGLFHVSAVGNFLSANQQISAILLGGTAFVGDVSALSPDASLFRVSAIGGTAGDHTLVDGTTQTISATLTPISASPATTVAGLVTNTFQQDAGKLLVSGKSGDAGVFRISAIGSPTVSDAGTFLVSAKQGDAGLLHVSALGTFLSANQQISAILLGGTSNIGDVSALSPDAGLFRISAINSISALSPDAGLFRVSAIGGTVSAFINQGTISAYSPDAGLFRVSSQNFDRTTSAFLTTIGDSLAISAFGTANLVAQLSGTWTGTVAFQATVDEANWFSLRGIDLSTNQFVSATTISRNVQFEIGGLRRFRISSTAAMTGTLSAFLDATAAGGDTFISIEQDDAAYARISALSPDAGGLHVSAFSGDANQVHTSAVQGDAGLQHVSAINALAASFLVSASQGSADQLRISAILAAGVSSSGAANFGVSAAQVDAGALHTSASLFPNTTGGLTIFSNYNLSTSINVKATAGAPYGWYAWNNDSKPVWINFYNVTGAINVGVDAIKMQIYLPASAAANSFTDMGLVGFTNGISLAAVSAAVSTANTPPAGSAVGINLFYK